MLVLYVLTGIRKKKTETNPVNVFHFVHNTMILALLILLYNGFSFDALHEYLPPCILPVSSYCHAYSICHFDFSIIALLSKIDHQELIFGTVVILYLYPGSVELGWMGGCGGAFIFPRGNPFSLIVL